MHSWALYQKRYLLYTMVLEKYNLYYLKAHQFDPIFLGPQSPIPRGLGSSPINLQVFPSPLIPDVSLNLDYSFSEFFIQDA